MPAPRFIILLAVLAVVLAGWIFHWGALSPAPDPAAGAGRPHSSPQPPVRAAPHAECVDDVSVSHHLYIADYSRSDYRLVDPPDYGVDGDHEIRIDYWIDNHSCQEVTLAVELRGTKSKALISDADPPDATNFDPCTSSTGCVIAAGKDHWGHVLWDLSQHPVTSGESVTVSFTISAPAGFTDVDSSKEVAGKLYIRHYVRAPA